MVGRVTQSQQHNGLTSKPLLWTEGLEYWEEPITVMVADAQGEAARAVFEGDDAVWH